MRSEKVLFERLMEPGRIGALKTRNRIIKTAAGTGYAENGLPSKKMASFYGRLAQGGVGLIIVENCSVEWPRGTHIVKTGLRFHSDDCIPYHAMLVNEVHKYGCPVFIQLMHAGPWFLKEEGIPPHERVAVSSIPEEELPSDAWVSGRELSLKEIEELVEIFASAAERAQKAGYDGVEINGSYYHLINHFLSRFWNRRSDQYGCQNIENRTRFYCEVIREVKRRCGKDYPVATNINGMEYGLKNGLVIEEAKEIAKFLEAAGADILHVRVAGYGEYGSLLLPEHILYPEVPKDLDLRGMNLSEKGVGILVPLAGEVKRAVAIPVYTSGRLDPLTGERLLQKGVIDFVGMTRRLIADPDLPNKVASGRIQEIVPCMGCGYCAHSRIGDRPLKCRVNPLVGRYDEKDMLPSKKKRVLIIGAGPAGLEAARVAALRGHEVHLYEREGFIGGSMFLAAVVKEDERDEIVGLIRYYEEQLRKLGVKVHLGMEVDVPVVGEINPDVVIVATGGKQAELDLNRTGGINRPKWVSSSQLHRLLKQLLKFLPPKVVSLLSRLYLPVGKEVIIVGGGVQGCQLAEFLLKRGRKVKILEWGESVGEGLLYDMPFRFHRWMAAKGVTILTGVRCKEVVDGGIRVETREGKELLVEGDTVIVALPPVPNNSLYKVLSEKFKNVYQAGDCKQFGYIHGAIEDGWSASSVL